MNVIGEMISSIAVRGSGPPTFTNMVCLCSLANSAITSFICEHCGAHGAWKWTTVRDLNKRVGMMSFRSQTRRSRVREDCLGEIHVDLNYRFQLNVNLDCNVDKIAFFFFSSDMTLKTRNKKIPQK